MEKLNNCKVGQIKRIVAISADAPFKIKLRLLELGFTNGQRIKLAKKSLFGDTFLVEIRGYCLSMRKNIADFVFVE